MTETENRHCSFPSLKMPGKAFLEVPMIYNRHMLQHIELHCQHPEEINLVQLTDMHIAADPDELLAGINTTDTLLDVIDAVNRHENLDLALLTGDLANDPCVEVYEKLAGILRRVELPAYCLAGNHDDPVLMERLLNRANASTANFLTGGTWAIILLNTHKPGTDGGCLPATELSCLEVALERSRDKHVLVCLHHHPVSIRSPWMDAMALENSEALFQALERHDNVRGLLWGHVHQEFSMTRNGALLLGSPSTCVQFRPQSAQPGIDARPPAYRTLTLAADGAIRTRVHWL